MTDRSTVTRLEDYAAASYATARSRAQASPSSDGQGFLQAGLHYIAADLSELAKTAPPDKAGALMALVRLLKVLART
ncbi:MAG: hypothetical protein EA405_09065 [Rhodospirillales bacterium]|nr:MAG: hypothetical protein EA405_09065 [Rhodospirillales bacterium]